MPLRRCFWLNLGGGLEQTTKFFLTGLTMGAFPGLEVLYHFVSDFETFEADDTDEFIAQFPYLTLPKLQRHPVS
jgi:hypothetical protein